MAKMAKVIRCRGDTTVSNADDGSIMVHLSKCNMTSRNDSMIPDPNYDSAGALRFTVTVVTVYGVAVVGVFALGLLKRKKPRDSEDKEAQHFMKDYENVRRNFEQKSRVGAISTLLHHIHRKPDGSSEKTPQKGLLTNLAFLALPLAKIAEKDETQEELAVEQEETSSKTQSTESTDSNDSPFVLCIMCACPLDQHENNGPLCNACVNRYKNTLLAPLDSCSTQGELGELRYGVPPMTSDCLSTQPPGEFQNIEDEVFLSESGDEYFDVEWEMKPLC